MFEEGIYFSPLKEASFRPRDAPVEATITATRTKRACLSNPGAMVE